MLVAISDLNVLSHHNNLAWLLMVPPKATAQNTAANCWRALIQTLCSSCCSQSLRGLAFVPSLLRFHLLSSSSLLYLNNWIIFLSFSLTAFIVFCISLFLVFSLHFPEKSVSPGVEVWSQRIECPHQKALSILILIHHWHHCISITVHFMWSNLRGNSMLAAYIIYRTAVYHAALCFRATQLCGVALFNPWPTFTRAFCTRIHQSVHQNIGSTWVTKCGFCCNMPNMTQNARACWFLFPPHCQRLGVFSDI